MVHTHKKRRELRQFKHKSTYIRCKKCNARYGKYVNFVKNKTGWLCVKCNAENEKDNNII